MLQALIFCIYSKLIKLAFLLHHYGLNKLPCNNTCTFCALYVHIPWKFHIVRAHPTNLCPVYTHTFHAHFVLILFYIFAIYKHYNYIDIIKYKTKIESGGGRESSYRPTVNKSVNRRSESSKNYTTGNYKILICVYRSSGKSGFNRNLKLFIHHYIEKMNKNI